LPLSFAGRSFRSRLRDRSDYRARLKELKSFGFDYDEALGMFRAKETLGLRSLVKRNALEFECLSESGVNEIDADRYEKLQAVKRWFYNDWRRIEPKLRTSNRRRHLGFPLPLQRQPRCRTDVLSAIGML